MASFVTPLLLLLTLSANGHADELELYGTKDAKGAEQGLLKERLGIPYVSLEKCEGILNARVLPGQTIAKGMAALESLNQNPAPSSRSCLAELTAALENEHRNGQSRVLLDKLDDLERQYDELTKKFMRQQEFLLAQTKRKMAGLEEEPPQEFITSEEQSKFGTAIPNEYSETLKKYAREGRGFEHYQELRVLTRLQHYAKNNPSSLDEGRFCREFLATETQDQEFARHFGVFRFHKKIQFQWAAEYGLTEAEFTSILMYMALMYNHINPPLWAGKSLSPELETFRRFLTSALNKLPSYAGPVRRVSSLPPSALEAHSVGAIVKYGGFTSTSSDPQWDTRMNTPGVHLFLIQSRSGKEVAGAWGKENWEKEILFAAGTRFKILKKEKNPDRADSFIFTMAEVDENEH